MNISYRWLKEYINLDYTPDEVSAFLTQIGLEVGSMEEVETIKGGLKGLVIGEVLTCEKHPDSDHLSKTTVHVGKNEILPIVCGAPNVATGQKVVVAVVGTTLYDGENEFKIKKSKIRGEASEGMICAEDEIGLGTSHDGIMVLDPSAVPGTPASQYFKIESDYVLEVDLTPNRIDSASHIGIARDLAAYIKQKHPISYHRPSVEAFKIDNHSLAIPVEVLNTGACPRYSGVTISGVTVKESPEWLKNKLKLIGLKPINNIVDVTNFVLFETGQPLHAFDAAEIKGGKVVVRTAVSGSKFVTLDGNEREMHPDDLLICNESEGMCIAGVFGGLNSGVKATTTSIFLESAWFDSVSVRKTARRHILSTDASFRFERGTDPNGTIYALKRAAILIKEVAGGEISSEIVDVYPNPVADFNVDVTYTNIKRLIGVDLGKEKIKQILDALEIRIESETEAGLSLRIPPYRVDVKREVDVIEEILRIYGYNNIALPTQVNSSLQYSVKPNPTKLRNLIAEMLTAQGFNEIWSNSLTKSSYYENNVVHSTDSTVKLFNPLSNDLGSMRQTLLYGGLESVAHNANRKNPDLRLYEFGNCYFFNGSSLKENPIRNYREEEHLGLFISGDKEAANWSNPANRTSFSLLKSYAENILTRMGFSILNLKTEGFSNEGITEGIQYFINGKKLVEFGVVSGKTLKAFSIDNPVYFADFSMDVLFVELKNNKVVFAELPKYPEVRRDLALLLDQPVQFNQLRDLAFRSERKLLQSVDLFDVYEGKGIPEGKKSYAISYILRDDEKTLNDKQIEKIMQKLVSTYERELGAQLR
jgi:phenylalanyl-tRNA synthetase beta chain